MSLDRIRQHFVLLTQMYSVQEEYRTQYICSSLIIAELYRSGAFLGYWLRIWAYSSVQYIWWYAGRGEDISNSDMWIHVSLKSNILFTSSALISYYSYLVQYCKWNRVCHFFLFCCGPRDWNLILDIRPWDGLCNIQMLIVCGGLKLSSLSYYKSLNLPKIMMFFNRRDSMMPLLMVTDISHSRMDIEY